MNNQQKKVVKKFCDYLAQTWPSQEFNSGLACTRHMAFADSTGFWHILFMPEFKKYLDYLNGVPEGNKSTHVCHII